jgi:methyl-accepting chemotaxis protein
VARTQLVQLAEARGAARAVAEATAAMASATARVDAATDSALAEVEGSAAAIRAALSRTAELSGWVGGLSARLREVAETLKAVTTANQQITTIADQVKFLAINARIEAARAGHAGRGFGVVAEAINELSQQTGQAAAGVATSIRSLSDWAAALSTETEGASAQAAAIRRDAEGTDTALRRISAAVRSARSGAEEAAQAVQRSDGASGRFSPVFEGMGRAVEDGASAVREARRGAEGLVDRGERILQRLAGAGASSRDDAFIARVQADAATIGALFEQALAAGEITMEALFSRDYRPIPGSDPVQVMALFTALTDRLLPPVQEAALDFDPKVVFCAAVDRNGYLPTHNRKFSQPQGEDPVWNAANCRNRRIFDDRVGLKAGRSSAPFLLQVYRRDMGGGNFRMMKDLSAPIRVKGRHWGGLRLAYAF